MSSHEYATRLHCFLHLLFYDLTKGKVVRMLVTREGMQDAALSPDGKLLGVAEWRDGFTLRDANTFAVLKTFSGSAGLGAWQVRFSPDGRRAIIQQPGEPVRVIDTQSGETTTTLKARLWATGAAFSPDGRLIATVRGTRFLGLIATEKRPKVRATNIVVHDAVTGNELARLDHPDVQRDYYQVGFSRNSDYVFSITAEKKSRRDVVLWGNLPEIPSQIDPLPSFEGAKTPPPTPNRLPIKLQPMGKGVRSLLRPWDERPMLQSPSRRGCLDCSGQSTAASNMNALVCDVPWKLTNSTLGCLQLAKRR